MPTELVNRSPLALKRKLAPNRPGKLLNQSLGVEDLRLGNVGLNQSRQFTHQGEIALDITGGVRTPDFDGDLRSIGEPGAMDLTQRTGCQWGTVKPGEQLVQRTAQLTLDKCHRFV